MKTEDSLHLIPHALPGEVRAYPSKSMSHRALVLAAQNPDGMLLRNLSRCRDVLATEAALRECGVKINETDQGIWVGPGKRSEFALIDCASSGSTLRFIIPYLLSQHIPARITGSAQLTARPVDEYRTLLAAQPASFNSSLPICLCGHLEGAAYRPSGKISSQYASGLMLASPSVKGKSSFFIPEDAVSRPYIRMTASMLSDFGGRIAEKDGCYEIMGEQRISLPEYTVEGDWSLGAFWLLLGAASSPQGLLVRGLLRDSVQGDSVVLDYLNTFHVPFSFSGDGVCVQFYPVTGDYSLSLKDHPDLFPLLCAYAALTDASFHFSGLSALKFKESNRILTVTKALRKLGAVISVTEDEVSVDGPHSRFCPAQVSLADDHRVAFACALWTIGSGGELYLDGISCAEKSWPSFREELIEAGLAAE